MTEEFIFNALQSALCTADLTERQRDVYQKYTYLLKSVFSVLGLSCFYRAYSRKSIQF